jgi:hypothetical protein
MNERATNNFTEMTQEQRLAYLRKRFAEIGYEIRRNKFWDTPGYDFKNYVIRDTVGRRTIWRINASCTRCYTHKGVDCSIKIVSCMFDDNNDLVISASPPNAWLPSYENSYITFERVDPEDYAEVRKFAIQDAKEREQWKIQRAIREFQEQKK